MDRRIIADTSGIIAFLDKDDQYHSFKLMERYKDLPLGIVDASLVILAERYQIKRILTLDRRHFNLIQSESIKYLEILP